MQVQLSLLCRGALDSGLLEMCDEMGIKVIGYSPLGLGILSGKYGLNGEKQRLQGFRGAVFGDNALKETQPLLNLLSEIASVRGKSVAQTAINWSLCQGCLVIVGAKNAEQGRENFAANEWRLRQEEVEELETAAKKCKFEVVQNIFQTN